METMSTEELAEQIFGEFWTGKSPDDSSKRVKDRGEKVRTIKKLLGKEKFVQSDQNFWIVTEEDLREWAALDQELPPRWKGCAESLIRDLTNGEIQSIDDLENCPTK